MYSGDGGDPTIVLRHYSLFCIIIVFFRRYCCMAQLSLETFYICLRFETCWQALDHSNLFKKPHLSSFSNSCQMEAS